MFATVQGPVHSLCHDADNEKVVPRTARSVHRHRGVYFHKSVHENLRFASFMQDDFLPSQACLPFGMPLVMEYSHNATAL